MLVCKEQNWRTLGWVVEQPGNVVVSRRHINSSQKRIVYSRWSWWWNATRREWHSLSSVPTEASRANSDAPLTSVVVQEMQSHFGEHHNNLFANCQKFSDEQSGAPLHWVNHEVDSLSLQCVLIDQRVSPNWLTPSCSPSVRRTTHTQLNSTKREKQKNNVDPLGRHAMWERSQIEPAFDREFPIGNSLFKTKLKSVRLGAVPLSVGFWIQLDSRLFGTTYTWVEFGNLLEVILELSKWNLSSLIWRGHLWN